MNGGRRKAPERFQPPPRLSPEVLQARKGLKYSVPVPTVDDVSLPWLNAQVFDNAPYNEVKLEDEEQFKLKTKQWKREKKTDLPKNRKRRRIFLDEEAKLFEWAKEKLEIQEKACESSLVPVLPLSLPTGSTTSRRAWRPWTACSRR